MVPSGSRALACTKLSNASVRGQDDIVDSTSSLGDALSLISGSIETVSASTHSVSVRLAVTLAVCLLAGVAPRAPFIGMRLEARALRLVFPNRTTYLTSQIKTCLSINGQETKRQPVKTRRTERNVV